MQPIPNQRPSENEDLYSLYGKEESIEDSEPHSNSLVSVVADTEASTVFQYRPSQLTQPLNSRISHLPQDAGNTNTDVVEDPGAGSTRLQGGGNIRMDHGGDLETRINYTFDDDSPTTGSIARGTSDSSLRPAVDSGQHNEDHSSMVSGGDLSLSSLISPYFPPSENLEDLSRYEDDFLHDDDVSYATTSDLGGGIETAQEDSRFSKRIISDANLLDGRLAIKKGLQEIVGVFNPKTGRFHLRYPIISPLPRPGPPRNFRLRPQVRPTPHVLATSDVSSPKDCLPNREGPASNCMRIFPSAPDAPQFDTAFPPFWPDTVAPIGRPPNQPPPSHKQWQFFTQSDPSRNIWAIRDSEAEPHEWSASDPESNSDDETYYPIPSSGRSSNVSHTRSPYQNSNNSSVTSFGSEGYKSTEYD